MDTLSLVLQVWEGEESLCFLVNGQNLNELWRERGGDDSDLQVDTVARYEELTVFSQTLNLGTEQLIIFVCNCGMTACSSSYVQVDRTGEAVTWSHFSGCGASSASPRDASGEWIGYGEMENFGPFTFDPAVYERVMAEGRRIVAEYRRRIDA